MPTVKRQDRAGVASGRASGGRGGSGVPGLNEIQALDLFANNAEPVYYDNVALTLSYAGLGHTSLGNAVLTATDTRLTVSNLGSSGQDGVSIALPSNLTGWEAHWQNPDPSDALPVGAYLKQQVVGPGSDGTSGVLGTVQVTKAGTGISNHSVRGRSWLALFDSAKPPRNRSGRVIR